MEVQDSKISQQISNGKEFHGRSQKTEQHTAMYDDSEHQSLTVQLSCISCSICHVGPVL